MKSKAFRNLMETTLEVLNERTAPLPKSTAFSSVYSYKGKDHKFVSKLTKIGGKLDRKKKEVYFDFTSAAARTKFRKKHKDIIKSLSESVEHLDEGKTEFAVVATASKMLIKAFPTEKQARQYIKNQYTRKSLIGNLAIMEVPKSRPPGNQMKGDMEVVKESVELDEAKPEYQVKYAKTRRGSIQTADFMTSDQAKAHLAKRNKEGYKGIVSRGGKPLKDHVELDEAWTANSVIKNAEIGSKKGYGINIKRGGGVTKTPFKHMLLTMQKHKNVRVTFDHGKDVFEGTPQSVALYINKKLGIKESVEYDENFLKEKSFLKMIGMRKFDRDERKRTKRIKKTERNYARKVLGLTDNVQYEDKD